MTASDDSVGPLASADGEHRRARRERAHRQVIRRRRRVAGLTFVAAVVVVALLVSGLSGGSPAARIGSVPAARLSSVPAVRPGSVPAARLSSDANARSSLAARTSDPRTTASTRAATSSAGSLPQTDAYPSDTSARFKSLMASLWSGIVQDSLAEALPAFFPKDAYVQLKAIASASSDWTDRLVHDYRLDITAVHALMGPNAVHARLIAVKAPSGYGHWIQPGVCDNSIGYYEMPNARVVYREEGQIRSFGIASMISWRGVWYVVHLGAILRSADSGEVDEPASGPGTSVYSGTC